MLLDAEARRRGETRGEHVRISFSPWNAAGKSRPESAESAEIIRLRSEAHAGGGRLTTGARGGYCEAASFTGIRRPYGTGHPGRRNDDGTGVYQDRSGSGMKSPGLPRGRGRSSTPAVGGGDRLAGELPASAPDL